MAQAVTRDIVCLGASAGGVTALKQLLSQLPADFPAAVFVVQHQAEMSGTNLAQLLGAGCPLRVVDALHGELVEHGKVYVAPADNHLLLRQGHIEVLRWARENGHRPAVNPLFRSAAEAYGPRVVAVVLTGTLDCGTAGLLVVKANGGVSVAEDPKTAAWPEMPQHAIEAGVVDHVVPLERMVPLLGELTKEGSLDVMPQTNLRQSAPNFSFVTCPHCHGSLKETVAGEALEFECHVGHRFTLRSLYAEQADQVEFAMWAAIRALEESAALATRMAEKSHGELRGRFLEKQRAMSVHANTLKTMVMEGSQSTRRDLGNLP